MTKVVSFELTSESAGWTMIPIPAPLPSASPPIPPCVYGGGVGTKGRLGWRSFQFGQACEAGYRPVPVMRA